MPTIIENNLAALLLKNETLFTAYEEWAKAPAIAYPTMADVQAATVPVAIATLRTNGRTAPGDLGGGDWKRVSSEPSHPGKMQSLGGVWWELAVASARVEMFATINDAAAWSGHFGRPVLMTATAVYTLSQQLVMPEGAQLINLQGLYNFVTRTIPAGSGGPRQKGLACIRVAAGLATDAIVFGPSSFNARITGAWIDCRNQANALVNPSLPESEANPKVRGVLWQGDPDNPRTQASLDFCWIQGNGTGINLHVEPNANEARLHKVLSTDTGTGFLFEGGDIEANFIAAPYNHIGVHLRGTRGRLRSLAMEAWLSDRNFLFEGQIADADITSLIGDDSGYHGLEIVAKAGEPAPGITIERMQISNSSRLAPGEYDDYFEDFTANFSEAGYIRVLASNMTGNTARYRINGAYNSNNGFNALFAPTSFCKARLGSGAEEALSPTARKMIAVTGWEVFNATHKATSTIGSPTGYHNLLPNGDFDHWSDGAPLGIMAAGSATLSMETDADYVVGTGRALGVTGGAATGDGVQAFIPNSKRYRGKVVTFTAAVLNVGTEPTAYNTRAQIHVNGSLLAGAEQIVQSKAGYQWVRIAALIPDDAEYIACKVTPAAVAAASGRKIYTDKWAFFEGAASDEPLPAHPLTDAGWSDYALAPFAGTQAAIDLRSLSSRIKVTAAAPCDLVGLSNDRPMHEVLVRFADANVTLQTYSTIKRADGLTDPLRIAAGSLVRFLFDGTNWLASVVQGASLAHRQLRYQAIKIGNSGGLDLMIGDSLTAGAAGGSPRATYNAIARANLGDGGPGYHAFANTVAADQGAGWGHVGNTEEFALVAADNLGGDNTLTAFGRYSPSGTGQIIKDATGYFYWVPGSKWATARIFYLKGPDLGAFKWKFTGTSDSTFVTIDCYRSAGYQLAWFDVTAPSEASVGLHFAFAAGTTNAAGYAALFGADFTLDATKYRQGNLAVGGRRLRDIAAMDGESLQRFISATGPARVRINGGMNDRKFYSASQHGTHLSTIIDNIRIGAAATPVTIVQSLEPVSTDLGNFRTYTSAKQSVALTMGCAFYDEREEMGAPDYAVALEKGFMAGDGIHPASKGVIVQGQIAAARLGWATGLRDAGLTAWGGGAVAPARQGALPLLVGASASLGPMSFYDIGLIAGYPTCYFEFEVVAARRSAGPLVVKKVKVAITNGTTANQSSLLAAATVTNEWQGGGTAYDVTIDFTTVNSRTQLRVTPVTYDADITVTGRWVARNPGSTSSPTPVILN